MAQAPGQPENHPRGLRLGRCIVTSKMCASLWPLAWNQGRRDPVEEEQRGLPAGATEAGAEGVSPRRRQVGAKGPPPPTQPNLGGPVDSLGLPGDADSSPAAAPLAQMLGAPQARPAYAPNNLTGKATGAGLWCGRGP